ncbi:coiled-coil domain-containing protein 115-like isoform X2 [Salvia splendens]|uniref:coiled-coil domain-containing protein 115-like isoform X2 n=1 Tax=Salvia splendens TaxID=180675 RepID=UPI001C271436|nr:coiled-coil domain-containing protein 115-like isoform X2 [Salvia splendens]
MGSPPARRRPPPSTQQPAVQHLISENRNESTDKLREADQHVLNFLDSMDTYLNLMDSLSSTLRQGWLELASARHSMGAARVSCTLFDLKSHRASTTLEVDNVDSNVEPPHFKLCKWVALDDSEMNNGEAKCKDDELSPAKAETPLALDEVPQARRAESGESPVSPDDHVQQARSRSLSMFGTLVSPKLRATQTSFERAMEMLVEISNARASLLHAHNQVQKDVKAAK